MFTSSHVYMVQCDTSFCDNYQRIDEGDEREARHSFIIDGWDLSGDWCPTCVAKAEEESNA